MQPNTETNLLEGRIPKSQHGGDSIPVTSLLSSNDGRTLECTAGPGGNEESAKTHTLRVVSVETLPSTSAEGRAAFAALTVARRDGVENRKMDYEISGPSFTEFALPAKTPRGQTRPGLLSKKKRTIAEGE